MTRWLILVALLVDCTGGIGSDWVCYSWSGARRADAGIANVYVEEAQRRTRPREPARRYRFLRYSPLVPGQAANTVRAEQIALGDAAYERFDNESALAHYVEVLEAQPDNPEALWKAARAYADVGTGFEESDHDKAKELYGKGVAAARKAVDVDPDSAEAHFILAVCIGRVALFEGGRTKIRLSREVKQEAERALELNPRHDGAYHVLGRWHYAITTLSWMLKAFAKLIYGGVPPGTSVEAAAEMFTRAIELDPTKPVHHLEYARALVELGRYSEARQHLETSIELPRVQWDDPFHKAEAARMLADIRGKRDKR